MSDCARVDDKEQRLACYDQAVGSASGTPATSPVGGAAPGTQDTGIRWAGTGMTTTRPFHMDGSWELQWEAKGDVFQAYLFRKGEVAGQDAPNVVANQLGRGPGSSYVATGGDFYLTVNAMGAWTAKVVSVP